MREAPSASAWACLAVSRSVSACSFCFIASWKRFTASSAVPFAWRAASSAEWRFVSATRRLSSAALRSASAFWLPFSALSAAAFAASASRVASSASRRSFSAFAWAAAAGARRGIVEDLPLERRLAGDDLVERDAEAVDVEARIGEPALALLERQVRRRAGTDRHHAAAHRRWLIVDRGGVGAHARGVEVACDAPVDQRGLAALAEQDVVRRDVAVHDVTLLRIPER